MSTFTEPVADVVRKTSRGKLVGTCPPRLEGQEAYCAKALSFDDSSPYDFALLVHVVRTGDLAIITQAIPLSNGELLIATRSNDYFITIADTYVRKIKFASTNLAVVRIEKAEVSEYYTHFVQAFFGMTTTIQRFDADFNLLEEKTVSGFRFPPAPEPPRTLAPAGDALSDIPPEEAQIEGQIWFPVATPLADGDYDVDAGHIIKGDDDEQESDAAPAAGAPEPPGIYIDVVTQKNQSFAATIIRFVDASGAMKPISGTYCTRSEKLQLWTEIRKKAKRSWFRKRIKITEIKRSLSTVTGGCDQLDF